MAEPAAEPGQAGLLSRAQAVLHYDEAVVEAVQACAEDTAGRRCYICMEGTGLVRMCACRGASGVAHVSCLARGAQAAVERGGGPGFDRWSKCGLCEQRYHGVVKCALGWACWKTYVDRPETDWARRDAMTQLGNGLSAAEHEEDALSVNEAELSTLRRIGAPEEDILAVRSNLACTYQALGRIEEASQMLRDVYSGNLRLHGEEDESTILAANNYAASLLSLKRFEEARSLMRKMIPLARRVLDESDALNFTMRKISAEALYKDPAATRSDLREAVTSFEDLERTARRVLGGAHPITVDIQDDLRVARAAICAREALDGLVGVGEGRLVLVQDGHDVHELVRALGLTASTCHSQRPADAEDTGQTDDEPADEAAPEPPAAPEEPAEAEEEPAADAESEAPVTAPDEDDAPAEEEASAAPDDGDDEAAASVDLGAADADGDVEVVDAAADDDDGADDMDEDAPEAAAADDGGDAMDEDDDGDAGADAMDEDDDAVDVIDVDVDDDVIEIDQD